VPDEEWITRQLNWLDEAISDLDERVKALESRFQRAASKKPTPPGQTQTTKKDQKGDLNT
jgi:hypothetical protein